MGSEEWSKCSKAKYDLTDVYVRMGEWSAFVQKAWESRPFEQQKAWLQAEWELGAIMNHETRIHESNPSCEAYAR